MAKLPRVTQSIFASNPGFEQVTQVGSTYNGSTVYTTNLATIQAAANFLVGWYNVAINQSSPLIEDMNAMFLLLTQQQAYALSQGIAEWDSGTTYYSGAVVNNLTTVFIVTSANATVGATYTNNGQTFTVQSTIAAKTQLIVTGTGLPLTSGTLTKATGTGDATITFSTYAVTTGIYISIADNNLNNALTDTTHWIPYSPLLGKPYQRQAVNSTGTASMYTYSSFNAQLADTSLDVPAGYNLTTGFLTIPSGITYTVEGSMLCGGKVQATGTGVVQATGTGIVKGF